MSAYDEAGFFKHLPNGRESESARLAATALFPQQVLRLEGQFGMSRRKRVLPLHPTSWKHPFVGHEHMAFGALAHQNFMLHAKAAADQNQGRGVFRTGRPLGTA
jgi:hypothetical protein